METATYRGRATSAVTSPSSRQISYTISPQAGATENDAEDLSTLAGMVEDVDCGAVLRELKPGQWKTMKIEGMMCAHCSGRVEKALNDLPGVTATVDRQLLGGGGHAMAAGATLEGNLEEVKARILEAVEQIRAW